MALIPPFFLDCVVAIGILANDEKQWVASGFLYADFVRKIDEQNNEWRIYLVTNRHVFEGQPLVQVRFNPQEAKPAQEYPVPLTNPDDSPAWVSHPDPEVDVAVVQINANLLDEHRIQFAAFRSDLHVADIAKANELGLTEGDGVFALGFPLGLVGGERNYVIVRAGVIARIRDALSRSTKEFLADIPIFPGNSGGPVVTRPEMSSIQGTKSQRAAYLVGMVKAYVPYQEVAISQQTKRPRIVFEENSGLAAVIPVDFIKETIEHHLINRCISICTSRQRWQHTGCQEAERRRGQDRLTFGLRAESKTEPP